MYELWDMELVLILQVSVSILHCKDEFLVHIFVFWYLLLNFLTVN